MLSLTQDHIHACQTKKKKASDPKYWEDKDRAEKSGQNYVFRRKSQGNVVQDQRIQAIVCLGCVCILCTTAASPNSTRVDVWSSGLRSSFVSLITISSLLYISFLLPGSKLLIAALLLYLQGFCNRFSVKVFCKDVAQLSASGRRNLWVEF